MVGGALSRGLAVLAELAAAPDGRSVQQVADALGLPKSAAHRILVTLVSDGWARQDPSTGGYRLTLRLAALGLGQLARHTLIDLARPVLADLATTSGELVRLSLVDGDRLVWVAKAQGATAGLRYDPDPGPEAHLASTANGLAWLAGFGDERALELVLRQGLAGPGERGPQAPATIEEFLRRLRRARVDGYARAIDSFEAGAAAIAMPVLDGPTARRSGCSASPARLAVHGRTDGLADPGPSPGLCGADRGGSGRRRGTLGRCPGRSGRAHNERNLRRARFWCVASRRLGRFPAGRDVAARSGGRCGGALRIELVAGPPHPGAAGDRPGRGARRPAHRRRHRHERGNGTGDRRTRRGHRVHRRPVRPAWSPRSPPRTPPERRSADRPRCSRASRPPSTRPPAPTSWSS